MRIPRGSVVYDVTEALKGTVLECLARSGACNEAAVLCEPLYFQATLYYHGKAVGEFYYVAGQGSIICSKASPCTERYYIASKDSWANGVRVYSLQQLIGVLERIERPQTPESFCRALRRMLEEGY
uniref:Uncharacterized protein n=1 Tax=Fervidicoccus fontis TaxID=683846 RepID=A0A7J3ZKP6_9CREN